MKLTLLRPGVMVLALVAFCCSSVLAQLNVSISVSNPTCAGFTNGTATATVSGGSGNYTYAWSNGQAGQTTFGISSGPISVTVTDDLGRTGTRSATVQAPPPLVGTFTQGGPTCAMTDAATISVSGGAAPYTYAWRNNPSTSASASNLGFGTSCVDVTDANGCDATFCITPQQPLMVELETIDPLCAGGCDAVVIAIVSGGVQPVTYQWDNGHNGAVNDMLIAGTYCVTVTDAAGCSVNKCATVGQPANFNISFNTTDPDCGGSNGSISATATGGTAPYTYSYNTGATTASLNNLSEGTYTLTVTDANGCSTQESVSLTGSNLIVSVIPNSPPCGAGPNGSATANVSGGTAPFTYSWSTGTTSATAGNLLPGSYTVTVTDANGCTGTASTTINAGSVLSVTATSTNQLCTGSNDGSASANVSGGSAPYTYSWSNGASDATIDQLAPGNYTVMVSDANGCTGSAAVSITAAVSLTCSVTVVNEISIAGADDGQLTAQFTGGVAPYQVSWSTGAATQTLSNLGPGTYSATVTDANGCTTTCSATLVQPVTILGKIGDFVFRDLNRDGQQDPGEPGVRGIRVELIYPDGSRSPTFTTGADGLYCFGDLLPGDYQVEFEIKLGDDVFTLANVGNDATDSDAIPGSKPQIGTTGIITISSGDTILTVDAGVFDACIPVNPGMIMATDNTVCGVGAIPGPITSTVPATSTGAIRYLWMVNTTNDPNFANWSPAPGVNNQASYQPGPISERLFFARCAFGLNCSVPVETNVVSITPGNTARAIIDGPTSVCAGDAYTFNAVNPGGGASFMWDFGPSATPGTSTRRNVSVTWSVFGQRNVTLQVNAGGCETFATQRVTISNCLAPRAFPVNTKVTVNNTVELDWAMAEDLDPGIYRVERSFDGGVSYDEIGTVAIKESRSRQTYDFTDAAPKKGYNVYRVCRILEAGDTYFSEPASASFLQEKVELFAYPNPVVDNVTIERFEYVDETRTVEVVDQSGRVLRTITFPAGERIINVGLEEAPLGQLHVRMNSPEGVVGSLSILKQ